MIVYVSYSKRFYGTAIFGNISEAVRSVFGDVDIIDPSDHGWKCDEEKSIVNLMDNMQDVFFPLIAKSDIFIAVKNTDLGRYTPGSLLEIEFAREREKTVIELMLLLTPMYIDNINVSQITKLIKSQLGEVE